MSLSRSWPGRPEVLAVSPHLRCGAGVQGSIELFGGRVFLLGYGTSMSVK